MPAPLAAANGSRVLAKQYGCTARKSELELPGNFETVPSYYFSALAVPLAHAAPRAILPCVRTTDHGGALENAFAAWIGHPVILQVALGDIRVPLRGKLLKDSGETLRMRIGEGWDVDIYKAMVLAVEEDSMTTLPA
jgi:hypothetical protein